MKNIKVAVLGTRGFPGVQGGVEAHCEKLYPRLASLGCDVTVFTRAPYVDTGIGEYKKVRLAALTCPRSKNFEAIIHTVKGIFAAGKMRPDILHIHAIGPSLLVPLAKLLGLRVVMTNHGPDYKRKKWNFIARFALRMGERMGSRFADGVICISEKIGRDIRIRYGRDADVIPNGVEAPVILRSEEALKKYSLTGGRYILTVGRFVPEKGFDYLIDAFAMASPEGWKLVIAGDADHEDRYSRALKKKAAGRKDVVLTGFLKGRDLGELYSRAGLFVLPSYYEGLPIALLEAMSYGLSCVASAIDANREVPLPGGRYFAAGDTGALAGKIREFTARPFSGEESLSERKTVLEKYDWDVIAGKTLEVYRRISGGRNV